VSRNPYTGRHLQALSGWRRIYATARDIVYTFTVWHGYDMPAATFVRLRTWPASELIRDARTGLHGAALYRERVPRRFWNDAEALAERLRAPRATWVPLRP
jgi:hypothetical protein